MDWILLKILILSFFGHILCFWARNDIQVPGNNDINSHSTISNNGIRFAIEEYITNYKNESSLWDFYRNDRNGVMKTFRAAAKLAQYVANVQEELKETAYIHCHADQIDKAHNFLKFKKKTLHLIKDDTELLQKTIGQCLYTIQSFYSNTNWIEMKGAIPYDDFGNNDLMDVAALEEDTCIDISGGDCKNNIIVEKKLTSGYFTGRGNTKPEATGKTGKCSHGGLKDLSGKQIPRCGINKDTNVMNYSPHYHLHLEAAIAAVDATKKLLIQNGTGILDILGQRSFDRLFEIRVRNGTTLGFAIDYTASMTPEMSDVKNTVIDILTSVVGSANEPTDYVISMFHDPPTMNYVNYYTDGYEMINFISTIETVQGINGDCPEYAVEGMINAIDKMKERSQLLVFTDASAKDVENERYLTDLAISKNITITPFISGSCLTKRSTYLKNTVKRSRRSPSFFERISEATGGTVIQNSKLNTASFLRSFLEEHFPTDEVIITTFLWPQEDNDTQMVPIDSTITLVKISIVGLAARENVAIYHDNGTRETFTNGHSISVTTNEGKSIYSIQKPLTGWMKIIRKEETNLIVNVTAQSELHVFADLYQVANSGGSIRIKDEDNPIEGNNYTIEVAVYSFQQNDSLEELLFISSENTILMTEKCVIYVSYPETTCMVDFVMPNMTFQIKLNGIDGNSYNFSRFLSRVYYPKNVHLDVSTKGDYAILNSNTEVSYAVTNFGTLSNVYDLSITSSDGSFIDGSASAWYNVTPQSTVEGSFSLKATEPSNIISYTVTLTSGDTNEVLQKISNKLLVSDVERPNCILSRKNVDCLKSSLYNGDCSSQKWEVVANVTFSGVKLHSISVDQVVSVLYDDFTDILSGPLEVTISGTCCSPDVHLTITDVDYFISQCVIKFGSVETVAVDLDSEETFPSALITGMAISAGLLCALVFFGLFVYLKPTPFERKLLYAGKERSYVVPKPTFNSNALYAH